jgi:hypothetical protein
MKNGTTLSQSQEATIRCWERPHAKKAARPVSPKSPHEGVQYRSLDKSLRRGDQATGKRDVRVRVETRRAWTAKSLT